tara:strand:- start:142 stop:1002 length:861 start_codon:yes stop_codon:yes gene_type:complete
MIKSAPPFGDIKHDGASRGDANRGSAAAGESKLAFFAGDELNRCVYPIEFFLFFFADVVKKSFPEKNFFFFVVVVFVFFFVVVVVFVVLGALKMLPMRPAKSVFLLDDGGVLNAGHSFVVSPSFFLVFLFPSSVSFVPSPPVVEGASSVDIIVASSSPAFAFRFIDEKRAFMCRPLLLSSHQTKEITTSSSSSSALSAQRSIDRSRVREKRSLRLLKVPSVSRALRMKCGTNFLNFSFLFLGVGSLGFYGVEKGEKRSSLFFYYNYLDYPTSRRPRRHHVGKMRSN